MSKDLPKPAATPRSTPRLKVLLLRPLVATLVIVLVLAATWVALNPRSVSPPVGEAVASVGDGTGLEVAFDLVDHTGRPVTLQDFRGAPLLVVFGYTSCPDVCPTTLARLASVLDGLESDGVAARGAFVTIDPARDTPEVLADYVQAFHRNLSGLSGDEPHLRQATQSFRVFYEKVGDDAEDYLVNHSAYIYLLGPQSDLLSYYHPDLESDALLADVRQRLDAQM